MALAVRPRNAIARRTDPITSKEAAAALTSSGFRDSQAGKVLEAVIVWPRCTSAELARRAGLDRYVAARLGLVTRGPITRCTVTGKSALTWDPGAMVQQQRLFA